ncbi:hypothetical protein HK098_005200 [Nowakowskiella sp. JEL0407]|nr:hypothetical protein HK098_005200 [Nowakowskiella sp. JEL0407]
MSQRSKVLVASSDSRTGLYVVQNLLDPNAACRKFVSEVIAVQPTECAPDTITSLGGKVLQLDFFEKSSNEIAAEIGKQPSVDSVVLVPPASSKKVEFAEKFFHVLKKMHENKPDRFPKSLIVISAIGVEEGKNKAELKKYLEIEEMVKQFAEELKMDYCILRTAPFMHNVQLYDKQFKDHHFLGLPIEDKAVAFIDARDVGAAAAAIACAQEGDQMNKDYRCKTFELTGPEALTGKKMVEVIGSKSPELKKILSKGFKAISRKDAEEYFAQIKDVDDSEVAFIQDTFELAKNGLLEKVSSDLNNILSPVGIEPRSFAEFIQETKDTFKASKGE